MPIPKCTLSERTKNNIERIVGKSVSDISEERFDDSDNSELVSVVHGTIGRGSPLVTNNRISHTSEVDAEADKMLQAKIKDVWTNSSNR